MPLLRALAPRPPLPPRPAPDSNWPPDPRDRKISFITVNHVVRGRDERNAQPALSTATCCTRVDGRRMRLVQDRPQIPFANELVYGVARHQTLHVAGRGAANAVGLPSCPTLRSVISRASRASTRSSTDRFASSQALVDLSLLRRGAGRRHDQTSTGKDEQDVLRRAADKFEHNAYSWITGSQRTEWG